MDYHRCLKQTFVVFDLPGFDVTLFLFPLSELWDTVERKLLLLIGCLKNTTNSQQDVSTTNIFTRAIGIYLDDRGDELFKEVMAQQ